jgi:hypothetical protein
MKIGDILRTAAAVASPFIPGGPLIAAAVNEFLPDGKKIPSEATAQQIGAAVSTLTPEQQQALFEKEIDLDITESNNFRANVVALAEVDKAGASTRPEIAKWMAQLIAYAIVTSMTALFIAVWREDTSLIDAIQNAWPFLLSIIGTPTVLLRAYFGMRTDEKKSRYAASVGQTPTNVLTALLKAFKR